MAIKKIVSVVQPCDNGRAISEWYCKELGFKPESQINNSENCLSQLIGGQQEITIKRFVLRLGDEKLELWEQTSPQSNIPIPHDSASNDLWFQHICIVTQNIEKSLKKELINLQYTISTNIQTLPEWNRGASGIKAIKFKNPIGQPLELLQFPEDKGNNRWHVNSIHEKENFDNDANSTGPNLGIDHSAIGISDTKESLRFYQELLGFHVMGGGVNYGVEQDRLDGIKDTHVVITSLRPDAKEDVMGIELLQYEKPTGGRRRNLPKANEICDWRLILETTDLEKIHKKIKESEWGSECGPIIQLYDGLNGYQRGFHSRDPDKHAIIVVGI
ncbi:VOC family protein [Cyanobium sp. WAJ14-Wanaka]|uniref:VOC family protein n=1 Tax=Cyanobium sp. WAJ14-Wanaka TaxID=2823725 RepID=UPI0020CCD595|nr:VOC family protein [Cyanobium sp. WAJ14-Wanaka]MCP9775034.1 VOC family protein [Cyanobium sp. WAJ14-Wanaka]